MIELRKKYNLLANSFSAGVFKQLQCAGYSSILANLIREAELEPDYLEHASLQDFFEDTFKGLKKYYRNEYVYKNFLINKVLLGKHSLNTSAMLTELRVGSSKADVMFINGSTHIYEIKTEYDSFGKLQKQVNDYIKLAEYVSIFTSECLVDRVRDLIPENIGIITLTKRGTLRTVTKPKSNFDKIDKETLFDTLRKDEFLSVLKELHGEVPEYPSALLRRECKKLFMKFSKETLHKELLHIMKERASKIQGQISSAPYSLKSIALSGKYLTHDQILAFKLNKFI